MVDLPRARNPTSAGAWSKKFSSYLPTTNIDHEPTSVEETKAAASAAEIRESNRILTVDKFLDSATTEEKLDQSLALREAWDKNALPSAYTLVWRRAKIARNLIESDIDDKLSLIHI